MADRAGGGTLAEGLTTTADARATGSEGIRGHVVGLSTFIEAAAAPTTMLQFGAPQPSYPIAELEAELVARGLGMQLRSRSSSNPNWVSTAGLTPAPGRRTRSATSSSHALSASPSTARSPSYPMPRLLGPGSDYKHDIRLTFDPSRPGSD